MVIIPINGHRCPVVQEAAEALYQQFNAMGMDVLLDDRNERAGVLFADNDLIGIPHRLVISERNLAENVIEYKARCESDAKKIALTELPSFIKALFNSEPAPLDD